MNKQTRVNHPIYNLLPTEVQGFDSLAELVLDMRCWWSHYADKVWRKLDPGLWDFTQNPWVVHQTVSRDKLEHTLADQRLADELTAINQYMVHSEMCENWGYNKLYMAIRKQAMDEMHHARLTLSTESFFRLNAIQLG